MVKLFKSIDEKFTEIGFKKVREDKYGAEYERENKKNVYTPYIQSLCFCVKKNGKHIVQSFDKNLMDEKKIGNTCVGLTMYEMKLCLKKMKQMKWKSIR